MVFWGGEETPTPRLRRENGVLVRARVHRRLWGEKEKGSGEKGRRLALRVLAGVVGAIRRMVEGKGR